MPVLAKQARKRVELGIAVRHQAARHVEDLVLLELMGRDRSRQCNKRGGVIHLVFLPLSFPGIKNRAIARIFRQAAIPAARSH
jgi:hypothetical protein